MGQIEVLEFLKSKRRANDEFITVREMTSEFSIGKSSLHKCVRRLWYSGFLEVEVPPWSMRLKRGYSIKYRYKKKQYN